MLECLDLKSCCVGGLPSLKKEGAVPEFSSLGTLREMEVTDAKIYGLSCFNERVINKSSNLV